MNLVYQATHTICMPDGTEVFIAGQKYSPDIFHEKVNQLTKAWGNGKPYMCFLTMRE
jgi:uncharacterized protein VirK/YbjX